MKKRWIAFIATCIFLTLFTACIHNTLNTGDTDNTSAETGINSGTTDDGKTPVTLLIAAAASLEYAFEDQLIPLFQDQYSWITIESTYDSSGKLQSQIESGLHADVFMSASPVQMNALLDQGLIIAGSVENILENKIVLIAAPEDIDTYTNFADIKKASIVALGDPESVPAGQYAKEALENLNIWDEVSQKASFGANVTEVLQWVANGSAEAGVVYATDAKTTGAVAIAAEAPEGALAQKVLYPAGVVSSTENAYEAQLFMAFLSSEEAQVIFTSYGFSSVQ